MGLDTYAKKRRFDGTPEPSGARSKRAPAPDDRGAAGPLFVVQLHHARKRHYDFRLELDGVLKSWAVPKGPSLRPGDKRLAVEVEDHPIDYANFSGDIPEGHYGAGHVDVFDRGTWIPEGDPREGLARGELDFSLLGRRLAGKWKLVRTRLRGKQPSWLLLKRDDRFAADREADDLLADDEGASSEAPETWREKARAISGASSGDVPVAFDIPLARLETTAPRGDHWLHEPKWDGYRLLASVDGGRVSLRSRGGLDWTVKFPEIRDALAALPVDDARFDGELIALGPKNVGDFSALQRALVDGDTDSLVYVVFDLPAIAGVDLRSAALVERKKLLASLLETSSDRHLLFGPHVVGNGPEVFAASAPVGLEGIVSKRVDSPYTAGRGGSWLKVKHKQTDDFLVVGYTTGQGARTSLGALLLAEERPEGLIYVGKVGTGFDERNIVDLLARLRPLERKTPTVALPAHARLSSRDLHWVEPRLYVEVSARGWGKEGLLRQSSFERVRDDKVRADNVREDKARADKMRAVNEPRLEVGATTQTTRSAETGRKRSTPTRVRPTSESRVVYPDDGITKGRIFSYYEAVAEHFLPEAQRRPLSLYRFPGGIARPGFFQKHHASALGEHVRAVTLPEKSGKSDYLFVDDPNGLLELVQMNTIEFHPWGARVERPDRPDRLVFDLDPGEGVPFRTVVEAAQHLRGELERLDLASFVRTSGGKGLHVVVPLVPKADFQAAKGFSEAFARVLAEAHPDTFVATMGSSKRRGRIFVDWLRNARGATSVASWSLRARPGAPVAMPLTWDELAHIDSPSRFELDGALERARSLRTDPWGDLAAVARPLPLVGENAID